MIGTSSDGTRLQPHGRVPRFPDAVRVPEYEMPARTAMTTPFILVLATLLSSCATRAPFVWVDQVPVKEDRAAYRIASRDVISVRVWNQDAMSLERARVREDGRISLPFLKDVHVAGMTPNEVGENLQRALVSFIVDPIVTVTLVEPAPLNVSVLGEVATAGAYTLERPAGVLQAIAVAGGLTRYAGDEEIFILRRLTPLLPPTRIRFRYRDLTNGGNPAADFLLQNGDVVVVE